MAYATAADLTARHAAAVVGVAESVLQLALDDAEEEIDDRLFGRRTVRAHCLLALHILQSDGVIAGGEDGAVTSRKLGEIAVSYAAPGEEVEGPHSHTRWGRLFDRIAATVPHDVVIG